LLVDSAAAKGYYMAKGVLVFELGEFLASLHGTIYDLVDYLDFLRKFSVLRLPMPSSQGVTRSQEYMVLHGHALHT
jgi:hypothetical protein